jgi:hypothetical protein
MRYVQLSVGYGHVRPRKAGSLLPSISYTWFRPFELVVRQVQLQQGGQLPESSRIDGLQAVVAEVQGPKELTFIFCLYLFFFGSL